MISQDFGLFLIFAVAILLGVLWAHIPWKRSLNPKRRLTWFTSGWNDRCPRCKLEFFHLHEQDLPIYCYECGKWLGEIRDTVWYCLGFSWCIVPLFLLYPLARKDCFIQKAKIAAERKNREARKAKGGITVNLPTLDITKASQKLADALRPAVTQTKPENESAPRLIQWSEQDVERFKLFFEERTDQILETLQDKRPTHPLELKPCHNIKVMAHYESKGDYLDIRIKEMRGHYPFGGIVRVYLHNLECVGEGQEIPRI